MTEFYILFSSKFYAREDHVDFILKMHLRLQYNMVTMRSRRKRPQPPERAPSIIGLQLKAELDSPSENEPSLFTNFFYSQNFKHEYDKCYNTSLILNTCLLLSCLHNHRLQFWAHSVWWCMLVVLQFYLQFYLKKKEEVKVMCKPTKTTNKTIN